LLAGTQDITYDESLEAMLDSFSSLPAGSVLALVPWNKEGAGVSFFPLSAATAISAWMFRCPLPLPVEVLDNLTFPLANSLASLQFMEAIRSQRSIRVYNPSLALRAITPVYESAQDYASAYVEASVYLMGVRDVSDVSRTQQSSVHVLFADSLSADASIIER